MTSEVDTKAMESGILSSLKSVKDALDDVVKENKKIIYSPEELETMRQVKNRLQGEDNLAFINPRFLAYTVITCKNRVEDAIQKYRQYLKAISACDMSIVESDEDMWADPAIGPFLREFYIPCGVDFEGRQTLWIRGDKPILEDQEQTAIRAGLLYVMAIHGEQQVAPRRYHVCDRHVEARKLENRLAMRQNYKGLINLTHFAHKSSTSPDLRQLCDL
jgi:hypothetical protein